MLQVGDQIPAHIQVLDAYGDPISLSAFAGQKLILYFYPKDNTPGCTIEAINFESVRKVLTELGWTVIGISADSCKSHEGFKIKFNLGFILLSDPENALSSAFGAYGEKRTMARPTWGSSAAPSWPTRPARSSWSIPRSKPKVMARLS